MTCIVGLVSEGKVYIGGDSAGTGYRSDLSVLKNKKVFINGGFLFGFTSSFRMGLVLQHGFTPPKPREGADILAFMNTEFIDGARSAMRSAGYLSVENSVEQGGTFLVGYRGHLFHVQADFSVLESECGFNACGCGDLIAIGAMFAATQPTPEARIEMALTAAETFCAAVRRPFIIESIGMV